MAKIIVLILVTIGLTLVHSELGATSQSLPAGSDSQHIKHEFDDNHHAIADFGQPDEGSSKYAIVMPEGEDRENLAGDNSLVTRRINNRNLARLLSGMPQFNGFYARYSPEKRAADMRRFSIDKDDKEFSGLNSLPTRIYREPLARSTERLLQLLRDHIQANSHTYSRAAEDRNYHPELTIDHGTILVEKPALDNREKRRRCQFDPALGIKNPSSCDTDSYFGAADYTMRNVWDSAGRR